MKNKELLKLIKKNNGKLVSFRNLPLTAKYAIAYYMSIDGEAWKVPKAIENGYKAKHCPNKSPAEVVAKNIGFYTKHYGKEKFGFVKIPTNELIAMFYPKANISYKMKELYEERKQIWPIILDFSPIDEFQVGPIQDGWHRFSDYVTMGLQQIPCVYYE